MTNEVKDAAYALVNAMKIASDSSGYVSDDTVAVVANCFANLYKAVKLQEEAEGDDGNGLNTNPENTISGGQGPSDEGVLGA